MELYIAGGCSEHGRNAFLVNSGSFSFLVDAGIMKEKPEVPWPQLSDEQIRGASVLFLTHSHADHTGAAEWLIGKGFSGIIAASRETFRMLPAWPVRTVCLEDLGGPLEITDFFPGLKFLWGRSGHCVGSVWYLFCAGGRSVLFSGDYQEYSAAYRCDEIRDYSADAAVLDCAYGYEKEDARVHRRQLSEALDAFALKDGPLLFPVPSHGRGLDVIRLLEERGIPVMADTSFEEEIRDEHIRPMWFSESFLQAVSGISILSLTPVKEAAEKNDTSLMQLVSGRKGILVKDSQLWDPADIRIAEAVLAAGGNVVLTGKQDPAGYARKLYDEKRAVFCRISVHQNAEEMMRLADKNRFGRVIPYHCRQKLVFDRDNVFVLEAGDRVEL